MARPHATPFGRSGSPSDSTSQPTSVQPPAEPAAVRMPFNADVPALPPSFSSENDGDPLLGFGTERGSSAPSRAITTSASLAYPARARAQSHWLPLALSPLVLLVA